MGAARAVPQPEAGPFTQPALRSADLSATAARLSDCSVAQGDDPFGHNVGEHFLNFLNFFSAVLGVLYPTTPDRR